VSKEIITPKSENFREPQLLETAIRQRLLLLLGDRKQSYFVELTGESPANVSRYFKDRMPSLLFLVNLAHRLDLSLNWIVFGEGLQKRDETDWSRVSDLEVGIEYQRRMSANYERVMNALEEKSKQPGSGVTKAADGSYHGDIEVLGPFLRKPRGTAKPKAIAFEVKEVGELPPDWRGTWVPIVNRIAAGPSSLDTSEADQPATRYVKCEGVPATAVAAVIDGDSMEPDYHEGDLVIADKDQRARSGVCIVIVKHDGGRKPKVKRLTVKGKVAVLESLNAKYGPDEVQAKDVEAYRIIKHLKAHP
jgi:SOS-response transcriptional repressor LexA